MTTLLLWLEPDEVTAEQRAQIAALAPEMDLVVARDEDAVSQAVLDTVEIAAGWPTPALVLRMPHVRWVQHWAAGVDRFTEDPELVAKRYTLTNGSGIHAIPISEHILALMLTLARGLHRAARAQARRAWDYPDKDDVFELAGKTLLLIGVGAIGARTAELATALGMRVLGVRRDPSRGAPGVTAMHGPGALLDLLPEADVVVLTVPLTDETRGIIGAPELRAMKSSAIIINIGRGGTIEEDALLAALAAGQIRGAGLDVVETEPLPADSPLWAREDVVLTGHYAGRTPHYGARAMRLFLENLRRYQAGAALRNVVDQGVGY
jgi:phosphoglycerate dehydrogenase-like enzyme